MSEVIILTYHAVESAGSPLCVEPALFRAHADAIVASGRRTMTVAQLASELANGGAREPAVVLTFDDAFESAVRVAVPILAERGLTATIFCVAGHLGGSSDWATGRSGGFVSTIASADQLAETASAGFEIGSHGIWHAPLTAASAETLQDEVVASRRMLSQIVGGSVETFAYPYGALPAARGRQLVETTYVAACTTRLDSVSRRADLHLLPRIDAHYVRRPDLLLRALDGSLRSYLSVRRTAARARRFVHKDYRVREPAR